MEPERSDGGLSSADRATIRPVLVAEREHTLARVVGLDRELEGIVESSALTPPDDEHDPEGVTVAFERAQISGLLVQARARLADLDRALERLDAAAYGVCERCGQPTGLDRLAAVPTTLTCMDCASRPAPPESHVRRLPADPRR